MKRVYKRDKKIFKLTKVVTQIYNKNLAEKYKDHALHGKWIGYRECHIEPDWLLVYKFENETLLLVNTGSHTDVFGD